MKKTSQLPLIDNNSSNLLNNKSYTWLITGVAGFIGSHLLETLLHYNQKVIGIDNLEFGYKKNLDNVKMSVQNKWDSFTFIKDDICNINNNHSQLQNLDFILHHAALASVPGSIEDPIKYHKTNVQGFIKILNLAKKVRVQKMTYASSSAVYGENDFDFQKEDRTGKLLSPYAANKLTNEIDAQTWHTCYQLPIVGFRYFNIYGPRQDPKGAYSAVIPKWIAGLLNNNDIEIYGDGLQVRDFCYVQNVVNANVKACLTANHDCNGQVFNISANDPINLYKLSQTLKDKISVLKNIDRLQVIYKPVRSGDIKTSKADMTRSKEVFNYEPLIGLEQGLEQTINWYDKN